MKTSKAIIKKYENRRLYDSTGSRYVNLDDVARMIREGVEVQVVDARSGEDLTRVILTQIIMEDARGQETGLPLEFLRRLVMASDQATREFLTWYWNTTMDVFQKAQETFRASLSEAKTVATSPLEFMRRLFPGLSAPPAAEAEVEQLRRRILELEEQLARRQARAGSGRKKRT